MAVRFATLDAHSANASIIPANDFAVVVPSDHHGGSGVFRYKVGNGTSTFRELPFEPSSAYFEAQQEAPAPTTIVGTFSLWRQSSRIIPANYNAVVIPDGFSGTQGSFRYKVGDGRRTFNQLPFEPTAAQFVVVDTTRNPGDVTGPVTSTIGNLAIWTDATGTSLGDGPDPNDFVQDGDDATVLGSGAEPSGQVLTSDGAGGTVWLPAAGGGGDVSGPGASTDNAIVRWDGTTGTDVQNSTVIISDLGAVTGLGTLNGSALPAAPGQIATHSDDLDLFSSGAALAGQMPEADGAGNVVWVTPSGGGDVSGPGVSVVGNIPVWNDVTGTLLAGGLATSTGGNGGADSTKLAQFNLEGQLAASAGNSVTAAFRAVATGTATAIEVVSNTGTGVDVSSTAATAIRAVAGDDAAISLENSSATTPTIDLANLDATNAGPLAHLHRDDGLGLEVDNDGSLDWTTATGAQGTATNLPVFGALAKGVVPAAGAVPAATNYLDETGNWSTPPDTSGITELTGDVTAGPGSGSQAATIAADAVTNAKMANMVQATIKGRAAAAGTGDPTDLTPDQASTILDGASDPFLRSATAATTYSNILKGGCNIDALPLIGTGTTWSNMPAALTWFQGVSTVRPYWPRDLTYYSQVRIIALMAATPGFAGSKVRALYSTTNDTVIGNYLTLGSTEVQVTVDAASTVTDSGWINLVAGAKADVWIALAGIDGNGTADPVFQHIWIQFR